VRLNPSQTSSLFDSWHGLEWTGRRAGMSVSPTSENILVPNLQATVRDVTHHHLPKHHYLGFVILKLMTRTMRIRHGFDQTAYCAI
jgi:hypothetical protein